MEDRTKRVLRWAGAIVGLLLGVALVISGLLMRGALIGSGLGFVASAAVGMAAVGRIFAEIAIGMMRGKTFVQATGADPTKRTSPVVIVTAMLLFVPMGALLTYATVSAAFHGGSAGEVLALSGICAFVLLLNYGCVRELMKPK